MVLEIIQTLIDSLICGCTLALVIFLFICLVWLLVAFFRFNPLLPVDTDDDDRTTSGLLEDDE